MRRSKKVIRADELSPPFILCGHYPAVVQISCRVPSTTSAHLRPFLPFARALTSLDEIVTAHFRVSEGDSPEGPAGPLAALVLFLRASSGLSRVRGTGFWGDKHMSLQRGMMSMRSNHDDTDD